MTDHLEPDELPLLKSLKALSARSQQNLDGDCPSRDDVLIVFAEKYIEGLRKKVAEKQYTIDRLESKVDLLIKREKINEDTI